MRSACAAGIEGAAGASAFVVGSTRSVASEDQGREGDRGQERGTATTPPGFRNRPPHEADQYLGRGASGAIPRSTF
jgi:hypothetical protein